MVFALFKTAFTYTYKKKGRRLSNVLIFRDVGTSIIWGGRERKYSNMRVLPDLPGVNIPAPFFKTHKFTLSTVHHKARTCLSLGQLNDHTHLPYQAILSVQQLNGNLRSENCLLRNSFE